MKVAVVLGSIPYGGIENLVFDMVLYSKNYSDLDFQIVNVAGVGEKLNEFYDAGVDVFNVCTSTKDLKVYRVSTLIKLKKAFAQLKPDIVHTMNFSADYFSKLALLDSKTPVVTHIHNTKIEEHLHRRALNRLLSFRTSLYISVSKAVYNMVEKMHNIFKKKHIVLYNAINLDNFKWIKRIYPKNHFNLVNTARLMPQKNLDNLIKAFAKIHREYPNTTLTIVGDGKERVNLENLAKSIGINVVFAGYQKNVSFYLYKADLFVLPSHYEGFGNSHIEAIATGLPSIVSKNVPSIEVTRKCTLVCDTDVESIYNQIKRIIANPKLYDTLSNNTKELLPQFDMNNYLLKLYNIYNEL
ncbi:MAG TPA: glycosyltransferase [Desulfurella acetivorans]|uniref:Glycosyltransferase n=2 Tax=Desulfurella acetivorans TaxID=33002 RepID=A0A7C6A732_DESAE|nr:glycosyltransferase [Desulfurella acetivorans]